MSMSTDLRANSIPCPSLSRSLTCRALSSIVIDDLDLPAILQEDHAAVLVQRQCLILGVEKPVTLECVTVICKRFHPVFDGDPCQCTGLLNVECLSVVNGLVAVVDDDAVAHDQPPMIVKMNVTTKRTVSGPVATS